MIRIGREIHCLPYAGFFNRKTTLYYFAFYIQILVIYRSPLSSPTKRYTQHCIVSFSLFRIEEKPCAHPHEVRIPPFRSLMLYFPPHRMRRT